jgi:hypothetical protein
MLQKPAASGRLGNCGGCKKSHGNGEKMLAEAHRHAWSITHNIECAPCNNINWTMDFLKFPPCAKLSNRLFELGEA